MSFDITFIKNRDNLTLENIHDILEETDSNETDVGFITIEFRRQLVAIFEEKGLKFEAQENDTNDYIELSFSSYQVSLFDNQISIGIPYWSENDSSKIQDEIGTIANVLLENGFVGFNSQSEAFITDKYPGGESFSTAHAVVTEEFGNKVMRYVIVVLIGIVVAFYLLKYYNPKERGLEHHPDYPVKLKK